jgi:hypothetical protein
MGLCAAHRALNAYYSFTRTSSFSQALIKIYNALYFAQSIQLSNIVLAGLRRLYPLLQVWVLLIPECANSGIPPTQCSAPNDFL